MGGGERALRDACLEDQEILALLSQKVTLADRERIEAHLEDCPRCRSLAGHLEVPTVRDPEATLPAVTATLATDGKVAAGTTIDHFRVLDLLGKGGMADVYLAEDTKLGRKVALKMVKRDLLGSLDAVARFQREASLTARFKHPNIVTIHAVGEHGGRPYVALEHLEGETLRERMRRGGLCVDDVLGILISVAEALREAHERNVLHRDLKPDNIHLGTDGRVRVLDFGLAKIVETEDGARAGDAAAGGDGQLCPTSSHTRATGVAGTPRYMAPEQWRGELSSPATDVWALGVVAFQLLAGRSPFEQDTLDALAETVTATDSAPPLGTVDHPASAALGRLVEQCLDKAPSRRPSTADVLAALRRARAHGREPRRHHRRALWAAAASVGVAVAVLAWRAREDPGGRAASVAGAGPSAAASAIPVVAISAATGPSGPAGAPPAIERSAPPAGSTSAPPPGGPRSARPPPATVPEGPSAEPAPPPVPPSASVDRRDVLFGGRE
jgi:tRNA A-37 threonylcarbamoyl transferase component Bud32